MEPKVGADPLALPKVVKLDAKRFEEDAAVVVVPPPKRDPCDCVPSGWPDPVPPKLKPEPVENDIVICSVVWIVFFVDYCGLTVIGVGVISLIR